MQRRERCGVEGEGTSSISGEERDWVGLRRRMKDLQFPWSAQKKVECFVGAMQGQSLSFEVG